LQELPASPGSIVGSIPPDVSLAVLKSLEKAPEDRYQTATEFQDAWRSAFFTGDATTRIVAPVPSHGSTAIDAKELAKVETALARAMGPIAKSLLAKAVVRHHTMEALSQQLAQQIPGEEDRAAFLADCGQGSGSKAARSAQRKDGPTTASPIDAHTLEAARKALAPSLGPIASVVVSRAAKRVRSAEELYDVLAAEIPDEKDRKTFLAAFTDRRSSSSQ
jgi:hypothetical protein